MQTPHNQSIPSYHDIKTTSFSTKISNQFLKVIQQEANLIKPRNVLWTVYFLFAFQLNWFAYKEKENNWAESDFSRIG